MTTSCGACCLGDAFSQLAGHRMYVYYSACVFIARYVCVLLGMLVYYLVCCFDDFMSIGQGTLRSCSDPRCALKLGI